MAANDVLPFEFMYVDTFDLGIGPGFHPFSNVVSHNKDVLILV